MQTGKIIHILIVDDERKACLNLINILNEFVDPSIKIAGIANNTQEAWELINEYQPDAVFLDIEMPGENAFRFLERISPFNFEVIFVTAYDEYAIKAFKLNAIDYILKPISIAELKNAIEKLRERLRYKQIMEHNTSPYDDLFAQIQNGEKRQKITLRDSTTTEIIDFKDIYYVEAQSSYSKIVFIKGDSLREMTMSNPLSDYEELLPPDLFYRIHRSYLINCSHIMKILNDGSNQIIMKGDINLPVSRRRYMSLIEFLETNKYS